MIFMYENNVSMYKYLHDFSKIVSQKMLKVQ